jgi:AraC-like DNA-binding protein
MRASDARNVGAREAGSVRRWRPATLPEVEVIECDHTSTSKEGFEDAYTLAFNKTDAKCVTRIRYRRSIHECTGRDISLREPGETYTVFPTELPTDRFLLSLQPTFVSQIALRHCGRESDIHWRAFAAHAPSLGEHMLAILKALPYLSRLEATTRLSRFVGTLIAQFAEPVGGRNDDCAAPVGLGRARDLLHARSSEAVTLDELVGAAECGTTQRLIRGFRAAFGFTPHRYLTYLRLQQARELLRRGHDCGATAHAVGFYDQSQLNRHFVKPPRRHTWGIRKGGDLKPLRLVGACVGRTGSHVGG